jgi:hypothetical protein
MVLAGRVRAYTTCDFYDEDVLNLAPYYLFSCWQYRMGSDGQELPAASQIGTVNIINNLKNLF